MTQRTKNWNGAKWCRPSTRLAIYLRDGLACAWCGHSIEDGGRLSLDHVMPASRGGDNSPSNLITACERCNKSRGNRSMAAFAQAVAAYLDHGIAPDDIIRHIRNTSRRVLPRADARAMLARRGTVARVLAAR